VREVLYPGGHIISKWEASLEISGYGRTWQAWNVESLRETLAFRDSRGGAIFWLSPDDKKFPHLGIRVSGDVADVFFLPEPEHPGFRCLGGEGLPTGGSTKLVYKGCDPADGEESPNEFIVPFSKACSVAVDFFLTERRPETVEWFEL